MLAIRLLRTGKKNQPFFRIVVVDRHRSSKSGKYTEAVGFLNPLKKEKKLDNERIKYWLSVGAKPSDAIHNLLIAEKIIKGKKIPLHKKSKKEKKEGEAAPQTTAVAVAPAAAPPVVVEKPAEKEEKKEDKKEEAKKE